MVNYYHLLLPSSLVAAVLNFRFSPPQGERQQQAHLGPAQPVRTRPSVPLRHRRGALRQSGLIPQQTFDTFSISCILHPS